MIKYGANYWGCKILNEKITFKTFTAALGGSFLWDSNKWSNLYNNPPALLPTPNKERGAAEAVLKEFAEWHYDKFHSGSLEQHVTDFITQKYPSNEQ